MQPTRVLQPYFNRADTHQYAADKPMPNFLINTCKLAQLPDTLIRTGTPQAQLWISKRRFESFSGS
jgi:hypothetical protein